LARPALLDKRIAYQFKSGALREQALTHRSFGSPHNERLEFLGDGVLNCVVAEELYNRFHALTEGQLSRLRANLVRRESLSALAIGLGLPETPEWRAQGELARAARTLGEPASPRSGGPEAQEKKLATLREFVAHGYKTQRLSSV